MEFERPDNRSEGYERSEPRSEGLEHKFLRIRREISFWSRNTRVILIGVVLLCLVGLVFGEYGLLRIIEVKRERHRLEADITVWKMKQRLLEDEKQRLLYDPFTLEKMARERCGLYKPGELIFVFPDDSSAADDSRRGAMLDPGRLLAPSALAGTNPGAGTTSLDKLPSTR